MKLRLQKRLASEILKCSPKRVWFNPDNLSDIKSAITRNDIRSFINGGIITKAQSTGVSRIRARKIAIQKRKGRKKNQGSRKGTRNARLSRKDEWINKIRKQRALIKDLKKKTLITTVIANELYKKAKGGLFRSRSHLKLYLNEHNLVNKK